MDFFFAQHDGYLSRDIIPESVGHSHSRPIFTLISTIDVIDERVPQSRQHFIQSERSTFLRSTRSTSHSHYRPWSLPRRDRLKSQA